MNDIAVAETRLAQLISGSVDESPEPLAQPKTQGKPGIRCRVCLRLASSPCSGNQRAPDQRLEFVPAR